MCLSVHLSVRQSVRNQSDQFSALNSRHITQKLYISYWNSIWKFFSSSGTLLPHTGSYTVCYVICVTHWIHAGWSMSPRTSLESTKSIISLNRLSFDAAEFWCIISLKVINILLNLSFWQILRQMFTRYTVMFMYMDLSHINFEYLCKIIILLYNLGNHQENGHQ